jgi:hypothetical protein
VTIAVTAVAVGEPGDDNEQVMAVPVVPVIEHEYPEGLKVTAVDPDKPKPLIVIVLGKLFAGCKLLVAVTTGRCVRTVTPGEVYVRVTPPLVTLRTRTTPAWFGRLKLHVADVVVTPETDEQVKSEAVASKVNDVVPENAAPEMEKLPEVPVGTSVMAAEEATFGAIVATTAGTLKLATVTVALSTPATGEVVKVHVTDVPGAVPVTLLHAAPSVNPKLMEPTRERPVIVMLVASSMLMTVVFVLTT